MSPSSKLVSRGVIVAAVLGLLSSSSALAVVYDQYDAPASYYANATSTVGATLQTQLRTIISVMTPVNYGDARYSAPYTDADPNHPGNILTVYSRTSVPATWDSGATWNREHTWPQSRIGASASNGTANVASDQFEVRPADASQNSSRGNRFYGGAYGSGAARNIDANTFYPGDADAGDVARGMFYMATRYSQLSLVNQANATGGLQMGDLATLLQYNYADTPDTFERRRNAAIYGRAGYTGATVNNPYAQGNRNPFVDHPEWVWAVFGGGNNNSQITLGTVGANGASSRTVDFGTVIVGAPLPSLSTSVTISKSGANPTYFDVETAGNASSTILGRFNAFGYNAATKATTVSLSATTATAGVTTGTVTVDNLDITSGGAGQGSADGNDVVSMTFKVLNHSNASFAAGSDSNSLTVDLGKLLPGQVTSSAASLFNLSTTSAALTAGLDLDSISASGATSLFSLDAATFSNLLAGTSASLPFTFSSPLVAGDYSVTYTLLTSDANLAGATSGTPLTLTLHASVVPEAGSMALFAIAGAALSRRRSR